MSAALPFKTMAVRQSSQRSDNIKQSGTLKVPLNLVYLPKLRKPYSLLFSWGGCDCKALLLRSHPFPFPS